MQINLLSNAYLSFLLLPLLTLSPTPRITWLGSMGQGFHSLRATSLPSPILPYYASPATYARLSRYPDTKFFVALFCREFAARLPKEARHVQVNNVCPGTVDTGADNALPFWLRWPMNWNRQVRGRRVEDGARAVVLAVLGEMEGDKDGNGVYVANNAVSRYGSFFCSIPHHSRLFSTQGYRIFWSMINFR
jgi:NAD(P)-dependent dehydrogenase (short-subunit alcohol dehydrogenase family)